MNESMDEALPAPARLATRLRLLVLVGFPPRLDSAHGGRVVAQLLHRLADRHELALLALREPDAPPIEPALVRRCAIAREIPVAPHAWGGPAWRHRQRMATMGLTRRPARVAVASSRRLAHAAAALATDWRPDVIQIEDDSLAYLAPRLRRAGRPIVLVAHDPGLGAARSLVAVTSGRQRAAHRYEERTWAGFMRRTLPAVDEIVTFTNADATLIRGVVDGLAVTTIPLGIDIPARAADPTGATPPSVLFVGGYNHPPNADAALRLMREIMPVVRRRHPDLALTLVGADPTDAMRAVAGPHDVITGRVQNVEPYVDAASLLALPIALGGGMRVKLLEAMAAGKAIVASPLAAAGLEVRAGAELVLADDADAWAAAICGLIDDPPARAALAGRARAWAIEHLGWDARVADYERVYRRLRSASASATSSTSRR